MAQSRIHVSAHSRLRAHRTVSRVWYMHRVLRFPNIRAGYISYYLFDEPPPSFFHGGAGSFFAPDSYTPLIRPPSYDSIADMPSALRKPYCAVRVVYL